MASRTIKIRYKIQVTRRVRVETRVRYSALVLSIVRRVVAQARLSGDVSSEQARMRMLSAARSSLPAGTSDAEVLDAIQEACGEDEEDMS